jgi:D-glycero-D-manno-heptose 1,7-bisphosphate phosphatase
VLKTFLGSDFNTNGHEFSRMNTNPDHPTPKAHQGFFFDRDGVVNRDPHPEKYVLSWDQWEWMPGIFDLIRSVKDAGFITILVTSQKGVGKGLMSEGDLGEIHERMQTELRERGDLEFAAIYAYTGLPGCPIRPKPEPQMVLAAADDFCLDLANSYLIGDADRDIEMAQSAGVGRTIRVQGLKPIAIPADETVENLRFSPFSAKPE